MTQVSRAAVRSIRVIAGRVCPSPDKESADGPMAAEVVAADEPGWRVSWNGLLA